MARDLKKHIQDEQEEVPKNTILAGDVKYEVHKHQSWKAMDETPWHNSDYCFGSDFA